MAGSLSLEAASIGDLIAEHLSLARRAPDPIGGLALRGHALRPTSGTRADQIRRLLRVRDDGDADRREPSLDECGECHATPRGLLLGSLVVAPVQRDRAAGLLLRHAQEPTPRP